MPRTIPRVVLAGKTQRARQKQRARIRLRDFTIANKTKLRYESAVARILPFLEQHSDLRDLDYIVCEWIELQWARGESIGWIADTLSGLHFFWPEIKGLLRQSWRMFRSWRRVEAPQRAPPMIVNVAKAIIGRAVELGEMAFACLIGLGFHCMLRTEIQYKDLEVSQSCGIISLYSSKSGLRTGTEEAVSIRDSLVLDLLRTATTIHKQSPGQKLWPHSSQFFRNEFRRYLRYFRIMHLELTPYSLRRGGATYLLQCGLPLDVILLRGRWRSLAVARLYLQDGLAQIPHMRLSQVDKDRISSFSQKCPSTAFRP